MRCARWGFDNPEETKFCEECGTQFISVCPRCGHEVRPTAKFCGACGQPLTGQSSVQSLESRLPNPQSPDARPQTLDRLRAHQ